jgi:hypothetical protein
MPSLEQSSPAGMSPCSSWSWPCHAIIGDSGANTRIKTIDVTSFAGVFRIETTVTRSWCGKQDAGRRRV